jgi:hypothetical protein
MWTNGQPSLCRIGGWEDSSSVSSVRYLSKSVRVRSGPWAATFQSRTSIWPGTAPVQASLLFSPLSQLAMPARNSERLLSYGRRH